MDKIKNLLSIRIRGAKQSKDTKTSIWIDSKFEYEAEKYLKDNGFVILNKFIYENLMFFEIEVL